MRMALSDIFKNRMVNSLARKLTLNVGTIHDRIKYRRVFEKILQDDSLDDPFTQSISNIGVDWGKTKAFGFGYYNEIYINLEERGGCVKSGEYSRLVEDIVRELGDLCERLGFKLRAFTNEKPGKSGSPDVMYLINDGEYIQSNRFGSSRLWELSVGKSGDHRLYGMWVLKGPRVKQVNGRQAGIWDIAPTIYHLYGVKAPPGIDGMCLKDVMGPSIRENV